MRTRILSDVEFCLLAVMRGGMTGREIAAAYEKAAGFPTPAGTYYTTLRRLATRGFVRKQPGKGPDARERRFSRTSKGVASVKQQRLFYGELVAWYDDLVARGEIPPAAD